MKKLDDYYVPITLLIGIALIVASGFLPTLNGPADWLNAWTIWVAEYVALVIAAHKVWKLADVLIAKLK